MSERLIHTRCPLDGTDRADVEVYPASFDPSQISAETFSARRRPDRIHYRMVRNTRTGCLRADPILDDEVILRLYRESRLTCEPVTETAADTYVRHLRRALPHLPDRRGLLEVGCGSGFFLERLASFGFERLAGVEPSTDAVAKANPSVRPHILAVPLRPGLFAPKSFSLICGFQVLDHLVDPNASLELCRELLAEGGLMLWICHDVGSLPARLLGRRCPMIDIEHVVLYDRRTLARLFESNGFLVLQVFGVWNRYPLWYWLHLAPMPDAFQRLGQWLLARVRLERRTLSANFGNMGILARKQTA